jgi:hypothetical protein
VQFSASPFARSKVLPLCNFRLHYALLLRALDEPIKSNLCSVTTTPNIMTFCIDTDFMIGGRSTSRSLIADCTLLYRAMTPPPSGGRGSVRTRASGE